MRVAKLKRFIARPTFEQAASCSRRGRLHCMLDNYEFLLRKRRSFANEPIIPPPVSARDDLITLAATFRS